MILCMSDWVSFRGMDRRERTAGLLLAIGEKMSCEIHVQGQLKKDQAVIENNHSFCCGRESPPSLAIAARDLPRAPCLVRGEVEK